MDRIQSHFAACDPMVTAVLAAVPGLAAYPLESAAWLHKLTRDDHIAFGVGTTVGCRLVGVVVAAVGRCGMDLRNRLRM
jgi:hypothetical protein